MTTKNQTVAPHLANIRNLTTELEEAALNARNLLHIANRELLENLELGLSVVAAAERYVTDIIALNSQLCAASAVAAQSPIGGRGFE